MPAATKTRPATHKDAAAASAVINAAKPGARRGAKATTGLEPAEVAAAAADSAAAKKAATAKAKADAAAAKAKAAAEAAEAKAKAEAEEAADTTNLRFLLMRNADFLVHAKGCSRIKVDLKGSDYEEAGKLQATTEREVVEDLWQDQIREQFGTDDFSEISDADLMAHFDTIAYHKCVGDDVITRMERPKPVTRRDAKQDLARRVAQAIADCLTEMPEDAMAYTIEPAEREAITTAWVHHLPTGTDEDSRRWWPAEIMRPDRSDWK